MNYGVNFTLKYISEEKGKLLFDVIDENGKNLVLEGSMQDLNNVLKYSDGLSVEMPFKLLQDSIFNKPILFLARRKSLKNMDELDFNLWYFIFFINRCLTMIRNKKITFRVSEKELEQINDNKNSFETISDYIRRKILD